MKKQPGELPPRKQKKSAKRNLRGKGSLLQEALTVEAESARRVKRIASGSQKVYQRAHGLDRKADTLHKSIIKLHEDVHHERERQRHPGSEELIVEQRESPIAGKPFPIVGIGASAGGYEAFADFVRALPGNTGMAFVLVQHLDPHHKSQLTQLLSASSKIPVREAKHNQEVEPNHIYVIPEDTHLTIKNGKLRLSPRKKAELPLMPIDAFFRSLAIQQQGRAIGVVLSGTGSDGTLGVEAIKAEGGITFAQDDRSAKYYGMPGSAVASGAVDFVLSPREIAQELARIAVHPYVSQAGKKNLRPPYDQGEASQRIIKEHPQDLTTLFRLLRARTGVDFSQYKQSTLKRRIGRRMVLHKKESLAQYLRLMEESAAELDALYNDMLINVTSFFRDPKAFQALRQKVFPRLLKAQPNDSPLRLWVCGCSTGEEAYSLAMALVEFFEKTRMHHPVQIFATDISETGIEKARSGIYPPNIQQDVSPERLRRFFTKVNGSFQVQKSIRDMCVFARQNVLLDPPFSNLNLVSCRNVLIYLGPELQRKIIPLFHYSLRPNGILVLGSSETIGSATEYFGLVDKKNKIYVKRGLHIRAGLDLAGKVPQMNLKETVASLGSAAGPEQRPPDLQQHVDRLLLREFSPAAVVVNSDMDVVMFRGRTGMFLEHSPGGASLNLFRMLRDALTVTVRAALSKAQRQNTPVKHPGLELLHDGRQYEVTIEVVPLRVEAFHQCHFAVIFRENLVASPSGSVLRAGKQKPSPANQRLTRELERLKQDLAVSKDSMQAIIEEQEATNEELKSANEEIQSSNEELQSTNEELETAKEELQSTNEELTTLNEELQNRNVELGQANNDLQNLLASVSLPILMVGSDLTIRRFTPVAERFFNLIPSDVGRRLTDVNRALMVPDLDQTVRKVIDELTIIERETQDSQGRWFLLRVRPYRTRENTIEGAVIVVIDVDQLRRALDTVMGMVRQPLLMLGEDLKIRNANQAFIDTFEILPKDLFGRFMHELGDGQWDVPGLRKLLGEVLPRNKQVTNYDLEANFPKIGVRKLRLNASRFFEEGQGVPLILLAIDDVS